MRRRPWARIAARTDANAKALIARFEAHGCSVLDIRHPVDIVVGWGGVDAWVELKNHDTRYGRKGLNANQQAFRDSWRGSTIHTCATVGDVDATVAWIKALARVRGAA